MNPSNKIFSFREKMKKFIIRQNILSTIASVTIAIAAGTVIKSLVSDIIFPLYDYLAKDKANYKGINKKNYDPISYFHLLYFGKEFINFIIVLVSTFIFIYFFMSYVFNINRKEIENENIDKTVKTNTSVTR
jgi:large-conductance mechanosensitive channel